MSFPANPTSLPSRCGSPRSVPHRQSSLATGPRFALPRESPWPCDWIQSPLPTLIKSSGAKNCRVSIPVCKPYTKPLGTNCLPPTLLGPRAKLVIPRGEVGTTSTRSEDGPRRSSVSHGRRDSISATTWPQYSMKTFNPVLLPLYHYCCHSKSLYVHYSSFCCWWRKTLRKKPRIMSTH